MQDTQQQKEQLRACKFLRSEKNTRLRLRKMAHALPKFVVLKSVLSNRYAYYMTESEALRGYVRCQEEEVFSPFAKIEVETAKINTRFVHLRFCSNNKYWARLGADRNDIWIVAKADQPEEDMSKWSCTLFEPTLGTMGSYISGTFNGKTVRTNGVGSWDITSRVYVDYSDNGDSTPWYAFTFVDWDTLVIMPKYVTFKGYNDKYLKLAGSRGMSTINSHPMTVIRKKQDMR
ncbi:hypothetical protein GH714_027050 [Hevea brasiliensis]|uniref:Agglutinin domain-containing protein n=1 Tax=Hevea brasiliensis TaxID=3981 RepID=A0A6A6M5I9_HEVBR|nr:hypothetical protein GH714_027050 [Hevea brasiliensis]